MFTSKQIDRLHSSYIPEPNTGCWLWMKKTDAAGYGIFNAFGPKRAHRAMYEVCVGPIPDGLFIDHLCRVKCCVNPAHLEAVTPAENTKRAYAFVTHCKFGHAFDEDNTYRTRNGSRQCRICKFNRQKIKFPGLKSSDKTHCPNGHSYSGKNMRIYSRNGKNGFQGTNRVCQQCRQDRYYVSTYGKKKSDLSPEFLQKLSSRPYKNRRDAKKN